MQGRSMLSSFLWVLKQEESEGFREPEDVAHAMDVIGEQIKEAG
jgi:hypothetical protein